MAGSAQSLVEECGLAGLARPNSSTELWRMISTSRMPNSSTLPRRRLIRRQGRAITGASFNTEAARFVEGFPQQVLDLPVQATQVGIGPTAHRLEGVAVDPNQK